MDSRTVAPRMIFGAHHGGEKLRQWLMEYLCEPGTHAPLELEVSALSPDGSVETGILRSPSGVEYPIQNGIPRFVDNVSPETVDSFGKEWNHFNFTEFKVNWLSHVVANTFGTTSTFQGKLIVDAGGGSGAQSRWLAELGARRVIMLDLAPSVDGVVQENVGNLDSVAVVQCSIDAPPLRPGCIDGIVYCINVIQHTPSVERTAEALYALTAPGGEFVFNCYPTNDETPLRWFRFHYIYMPLRSFLSRRSFRFVLNYAKAMSVLRQVPGFGWFLEKSGVCVRGDVPKIPGETWWKHVRRSIRTTQLNTYDGFGYHDYQHHLSGSEIRALVRQLQPDDRKVQNLDAYLRRDRPVGCALRVFR